MMPNGCRSEGSMLQIIKNRASGSGSVGAVLAGLTR